MHHHADDSLSVFYVAATLNTLFVLFVIFILPESLSSEARNALGKLAKAKALRRAQREEAERDWEDNGSMSDASEDDADASASGWSRLSGVTTTSTRSRRKMAGTLRRIRRRMFAFVAPLSMFLPRDNGTVYPGKKSGAKDWNLTFLIMSSFCMSTLMASALVDLTVLRKLTIQTLPGFAAAQGPVLDLFVRLEFHGTWAVHDIDGRMQSLGAGCPAPA